MSLNYPQELYGIFVVADNCIDNTAKIAAALGANVIIRFNPVERGKRYALEYAFWVGTGIGKGMF